MLSLYNSLGLDGGSVSDKNRLLAIGKDLQESFPQYSRTTLRRDIETNPNDRPGDSDQVGTRPEGNNQGFDGDPRADINRDGVVDGSDLTAILNDFLLPTDRALNPRSDIDGSGFVNGADLTIFLNNWGRQFVVGNDLGVASGSYDERPNIGFPGDIGVRPSRPDGDGRPKPKPSDFGIFSGGYDVRPGFSDPPRPNGGGRPKPKPGDFGVVSGSYDVRPGLSDLDGRPPRPDGEDDGGGKPDDPPLVGVIQTINGLVYPAPDRFVINSPAIPMWIKERNV